MRKYAATNRDYEQFKMDLQVNSEEYSWFESEKQFLIGFKVKTEREEILHQVITINKKYSTHLSLGLSTQPDESGEFADFILSDSFQSRIMTKDKKEAVSLVIEFAKAAKTRGRFQLSFASKYCHHCNPNMFPIYDSVNVEYLKEHYSYEDKKDYKEYVDFYALFCESIGVDLSNAKDLMEGFYVDKFINNIEKK